MSQGITITTGQEGHETKPDLLRSVKLRIPLIVPELASTGKCRRYRIQQILGTGVSAVVFKAVVLGEECNGRQVALKVLKKIEEAGLEMEDASLEMEESLDEVWIQSELHHPNVVEFLGSFIFGGFTFIVLDLYETKSLEDMIKSRGYLTEPEVRAFTIQVTGAIKYLHSKGIIHRDLKPRNIGLDANMNIKVGDFGLAARLKSPEDRLFERCGTAPYTAPEVFEHNGDGYDRRIDLWSLGVIIYKMLVGSTPLFDEGVYDWSRVPDCYLNEGARSLVGALLVQASDRLGPDEVVMHPFIANGSYMEKLSYTFRTSVSLDLGQVRDVTLFQRYCRLAGIGKDEDGEFWPCVGTEECVNPIRDLKGGIWTTLGFEWA